VGRRIILKRNYGGVTFQHGLNNSALNALAATVHDANAPDAGVYGGVQVLLDDRGDISRKETVKVELWAYWHFDRLVFAALRHNEVA